MKIALLDDEELEALIDFHESTARDAEDSCEHEEAKRRRQRAAYLKSEITAPERKIK